VAKRHRTNESSSRQALKGRNIYVALSGLVLNNPNLSLWGFHAFFKQLLNSQSYIKLLGISACFIIYIGKGFRVTRILALFVQVSMNARVSGRCGMPSCGEMSCCRLKV
jgi:hypothetical protein